jgi:hypothetical protein
MKFRIRNSELLRSDRRWRNERHPRTAEVRGGVGLRRRPWTSVPDLALGLQSRRRGATGASPVRARPGPSLLFWRDGRPAAVFAAQVDDRLRFRATDDPGARHATAGADYIARLSLAHRWAPCISVSLWTPSVRILANPQTMEHPDGTGRRRRETCVRRCADPLGRACGRDAGVRKCPHFTSQSRGCTAQRYRPAQVGARLVS